MKIKIKRCSSPGAWWEKHIGRVVEVLFTDSHGHWTRDTNPPNATGPDAYPFLQWVDPKDTEPVTNTQL